MFTLTAKDYTEYIKLAYELIHSKGDYITELDSVTGDGDHWTNINMGFENLVKNVDRLETMELSDEFKEIGKIMMSVIGGSSGVLYGSAYIAAAKALKGIEVLHDAELCTVLKAMLDAIVARGQAKEGYKTMIDSLAPAVKKYEECLANGTPSAELCELVKKAAEDGRREYQETWKQSEDAQAIRQTVDWVIWIRAAVTMSYQIATLMDYAAGKITE